MNGKMTPKLLRTLAGEAVWPPPLWLMRQAGRHLPEYRALRAKSSGLIEMCLTPEVAAEVTLQPVRRYGFDAAILFSDIIMLPYALGQDVRLVEGKGPVLKPIRTANDMAVLDPARLVPVIAPILETVRRVRAALPADKALIGFAGSPWTVVCYMVEGQGSRDFAEVRNLAYRDPALFDALMQRVTLATIEYLAQQIEAGADVAMLFDSWAGVLPAAQFRRYVIEPTRQIVAALKLRYPQIPVIGFPRLAGSMLGEYALAGVQAVGVDTSADPARAAAMVPASIALQGNVDPLALLAGGDALAGAARTVLDSWRGRPFIFNLGHGVVPQTPPEHVAELARIVRDA
jgi:uroporphyrinogen decarboxylase